MKSAAEFLKQSVAEKQFSSAVGLVGEKGEIVFQTAEGFAAALPKVIPANAETIYDLASLTKVLVTSLLIAKLIERGEIALEDELSKFFPNAPSEIIVRQLVTHTSGFTAWKPFYLLIKDAPREILKTEIQRVIFESERLPYPPQVVYSDLNFLLLTFLIEKIFGQTIDSAAENEIFRPLKLRKTFYNPPKNLLEKIAASEFGNQYEKQTCAENGFDVSAYKWRDHQIWGEVHDGNCFFLKGISGHAGLFSDASETFLTAQQFLANQTQILAPETCLLFRKNLTENLNEARSLGFQLAATKDSTAGNALAPDSFGHLGFTGTSLWIEPSTERIFILLTNRTHNRELPFANINAVRRRFHTLGAEALSAKRATFESSGEF